MHKFQISIGSSLFLKGIGVHSGEPACLTIHPAPANTGIQFCYRDKAEQKKYLKAELNNVVGVTHATTLGNDIVRMHTIEHLMSAISGLNIDNLFIEISSGEMPIFDGSAKIFVEAFQEAKIISQPYLKEYIKIIKPIILNFEGGYAHFLPSDNRIFDVTIDFKSPAIGKRSYLFNVDNDDYSREIAPARTFGFLSDATSLRSRGLACGSSLENSVIIDNDNKILNKGGLRFANEFVRHKLLDAMGDTALLSRPFIGTFKSYCSGHKHNITVSKMLLADSSAYKILQFSQEDVVSLKESA